MKDEKSLIIIVKRRRENNLEREMKQKDENRERIKIVLNKIKFQKKNVQRRWKRKIK